ncbi:MAG: septum formation protein Maf [Deltaproteobacteria bacterium]|nr:septum formation protein Maf [Deltaproteobacteria bacterium]
MSFPFISINNPLILASASPRRKELLQQVKIPFRITQSDIDENNEKGKPRSICVTLAEKKALSVYNSSAKGWILGADTIVVKDNLIMGKPQDANEVASMLEQLGGGDHEVITGYSIINPHGDIAISGHVATTVTFKRLTPKEINGYIKTGEPFGKAGAYAIQELGAFMITGINGSYSNVVGLPLFEVIDSLVKVKALEGFPLPEIASK